MQKQFVATLTAVTFACATCLVAAAGEKIKVAVPNRGAWDTSYTELGLQQGFFSAQGVDVQIVHVADEATLEKALVSGLADIAVAASFPALIDAWVKGESIRIISPEETGASDLFWFAKMGGPITSIGSLHDQSVGIATPGSLSHFVLLTLLQEAGVNDARLIPIGAADNGYPMVLNAELDASWSSPPSLIQYLIAGEIRVIARGNDSRRVRNQTVRVNAANANFLATHRSPVLSFLKGYKKSVDWAYSSLAAVAAYARLSGQNVEAAKYIVKEFASKAGTQLDEIKGEDRVLADELLTKRLPRALTHEEIKGVYDLVLK